MKKRDKWTASFQQASETVSSWREEHPRATFTDIENAVDKQLAQLRTTMIQDLALESKLVDIRQLIAQERPLCPACGKPLVANGKQSRQLITHHDQVVELERSKGYCRHCRVSFFPPG
jgi:uncharacterized protein with PIN domain